MMEATDKPELKHIRTSLTIISETEAEVASEMLEPLSPGAILFQQPKFQCYVIAKMGFKVPVDAEVFKELVIINKILKHPRFSCKLAYDAKGTGKPVGWVQTKVNVDDHLIVPDVDPNLDEPDKFVEDYISNITRYNPNMDTSKPLWEFHILNVKASDSASTIVLRVHHSVGDGISLISLLLACARKTSDPQALPVLPVAKKKKHMKYKSSGLLCYLFVFVNMIKMLYNTLVDATTFLATTMFLKDTNTPLKFKGASKTESTPTRFVHHHLSLHDIKLLKNAMNTTINDVILGIAQAGLTRYLNRSYGISKGAGRKDAEDNLPKHIRLRALVMVNLRSATTIEGLAEMMDAGDFNGCQWGNSIAYIILPFVASSIRDDPLDYIRNAKATMDRKKQSFGAHLIYSSANLVRKLLGVKTTTRIIYKALTNTTMRFSSVIGPIEEISLAGYPLVYIAPDTYGVTGALRINFLSYMDKMTLSIGVDEDIMPNPRELCDDSEVPRSSQKCTF